MVQILTLWPLSIHWQTHLPMSSRWPSLLHISNVGSILSLHTCHVREIQRKDQRCGHKLNICFCPWSVFLDIFLSHMPFIKSRTFKPVPPGFHCIILDSAKRKNAIYMYLEIKAPWRACKGEVTTVTVWNNTVCFYRLEQHCLSCCLNKMW